MQVIKSNGETEPFNAEKIRKSLIRVGAKPSAIEQVIDETKEKMHDGISTKALYRIVFSKLKKVSKGVAGKYHLKNAIMELGPSGYPFEKFVAELFKAKGFSTETGEMVQGKCVHHEVDIVAKNDNEVNMFECKFFTTKGKACDVKTTLYVYARYLDIENNLDTSKRQHFKSWLVTNTRFTSDAEQYGNCAGLNLMSWNFPPNNSLRERVDRQGLHPITCMTTLTKKEKKQLTEKMVVLTKELQEKPDLIDALGIKENRKKKILEESRLICNEA